MKVILEKIIRFLISHPWAALFGLVLLLILITFLPFGGASEEKTVQQKPEQQSAVNKAAKSPDGAAQDLLPQDPPPLVPENSAKKKDKSSPYDDNEARRRAAVQDIAEDPAVQYLPYRGALILADIADSLGDKLVIHVYYAGDRSFAEREWREFLESHKDDGSSYQVIYIEKG